MRVVASCAIPAPLGPLFKNHFIFVSAPNGPWKEGHSG